jgi:hypothetical protein
MRRGPCVHENTGTAAVAQPWHGAWRACVRRDRFGGTGDRASAKSRRPGRRAPRRRSSSRFAACLRAGREDVLVAIALQQQSQLSVWDVMVIHAAAEAGADVLWTGDLSDRQVLHVRIRNPFADARENS